MPDSPAPEGPALPELLGHIVRGQDLDAETAEAFFHAIMEGRTTPVQAAAFLTALRAKGEHPVEVAGGVRALRAVMVQVPATNTEDLVDTCGTGGGAVTTFNISTAAALVAAGAGVRIAKHGNRSFTSRCGSADVLAELGVTIELTPEAMAAVLDEAGIVFMFAPLLHPAMRHVAPVRRELGIATVMNVLGPLTNPAGARRQVVGVADPGLVGLIARALLELGHARALVVHGEPGLDEISPIGATEGYEIRDGDLLPFRIEPADLLPEPAADLDGLAGATPDHNARLILDVLEGRRHGVARAAVLMNAAAAIYVADAAPSMPAAFAQASQSLDDGEARAALERLRTATTAHA